MRTFMLAALLAGHGAVMADGVGALGPGDDTDPMPMTGACCLPDGTCEVASRRGCETLGGVYQGPGLDCGSTGCVAAETAPPRRAKAGIKGSVLFFSAIEIRWDAAGGLVQDTFLSVTNDHPNDVRVLMYLINGDPPLAADPVTGERAHPGWNWVDNAFTLTGNQPTYFSTLSGQPAAGGLSPMPVLDPGDPPGRPAGDGSGERVLRGYAVAWAIDVEGAPIRWNHLVGNATVVRYEGGAAWEYSVLTAPVVDEAIGHGEPVGAAGQLDLDGLQYAAPPAELLFNFSATGSIAFSGPKAVSAATDLVLHPIPADLRQETTGPVRTKATFDIWNMNEVKFSGTDHCVTVWDHTALASYGVPNHFLLAHLQTDHGKTRVRGVASVRCDVDADGDGIPEETSVAADLTGVIVRRLTLDGGVDVAATATSATGMGMGAAVIRYDVLGAPPEAHGK
ncbi:MAG: hypothetical protein HKO59_02505 [Phycisphaerales bacterium]|nr:hypothetical protein [Phycisphaerae bacterium]NNF41796.1 hypothetical protein [Phycisphaerales bacterium]NNM24853.1 hypothetical protein [Phycisphaerales bacterium]